MYIKKCHFNINLLKLLITVLLWLRTYSIRHIRHQVNETNQIFVKLKSHHLKSLSFDTQQNYHHFVQKQSPKEIQAQTKELIDSNVNKKKQKIGFDASKGYVSKIIKGRNYQQLEEKQSFCDTLIKYSISVKQKGSKQNDCMCSNITQIYHTISGQKCLEQQPVGYPQLVELTCGFFGFLIPSIVAYLCRNKQELQKHEFLNHKIERHNNNLRNKQRQKDIFKHKTFNKQKKRSITGYIQKTQIKHSKIHFYSDRSFVQHKLYSSTISYQPQYACATNSFEENKLTRSLIYGYVSTKDPSLMKSQFT